MAGNFVPLLTGNSRLFINESGPGCGNGYSYLSCYKLEGLEKTLGDIESIYCPSNSSYDEFDEVGSVKGADSRWTSTISGTISMNQQSALERLVRAGCPFNLQVHSGRCTRPDSFQQFESSLILEDVRLTSYSLSELVAASPDERAVVTESAALSAGNIYRVFSPEFSEVGAGVVDGSVVSVEFCGGVNCASDCDTLQNDGCDLLLGYQVDTVNDASFVYSNDGGVSWVATTNATLTGPDVSDMRNFDMACTGVDAYVTFYDGTTSFIYRVTESQIFDDTFNFVEIASSTTVIYRALDFGEQYVWIAGETQTGGSLIGYIDLSTNEVTIIDEGGIDPGNGYNAVNALNDDIVLVGGESGFLAYSTSFGAFQEAAGAAPNNNAVTSVKALTSNDWIISANSVVYCTSNRGNDFTQVLNTNNSGVLDFYDEIVGYYANDDGIWRTVDSGNTWAQISNESGLTTTRDIAVCELDANRIMVSGGNAGLSGFLIRGAV